ncbi:hypothetical protein [Microvirga sp. Mcv34]|uniref:hypothetical protein n=1 Tax=Microvirga sp. Mcv34 TaxID=2926016 RepID=UPI0021C8081F|nr:hypothetical protein [Microvirga sp. Mcv34]
MISRRAFVGGCCSATLLSYSPRVARAQGGVFICSTPDSVSSSRDFELSQFGTQSGPSKFELDTLKQQFDFSDYGTSFLRDRWLDSDGQTPNSGMITLGVSFLNGSPAQQEIFRTAADAWFVGPLKTRLAFRYLPSKERGKSQIRVEFDAPVNESYIGRNCLRVPDPAPTMRISDLMPHVIQHECGHALGLQHEHQNPNVPFQWIREAVIADMAQRGWSEQKTVQNILDRYTKNAACIGDPGFNEKSIMLYPIPSRWTNRFSSEENIVLSDRDRKCLQGLYSSTK